MRTFTNYISGLTQPHHHAVNMKEKMSRMVKEAVPRDVVLFLTIRPGLSSTFIIGRSYEEVRNRVLSSVFMSFILTSPTKGEKQ